MRTRIHLGFLLLALALPLLSSSTNARLTHPTNAPVSLPAHIPSPKEILGFVPGDDRKLASWSQVIHYFEELEKASDRVKFETLGKSTMGQPFVMATISAPENLARLDEYRKIQELLADPRKLSAPGGRDRKAAELMNRGKTIVLITCGIHSTEVGSYLSSMLIAHRLASSNEPEIQNILHNTIVLLVPSLNPDGVDIVKNWYDKTLGTPYEGTDPPELYHKYVGHDNNRDWYAFTQVETQITVDKIHNVWHPQIVHDIHQQGEYGARLFLPPYMPPVEPNVPKQIVAGYTELGNYMAREMRAAGFTGLTTNSTYDAWTPARAYSHYHGGVRILSETASCKIATPITVKFNELKKDEGYDPKKESATYGPLWHGGEWHLRDITNYMTSAAFLLLRHASDNRNEWLSRFYEIGKEAVRPRKTGELFGFVILPSGLYSQNSSKLVNLLAEAEVEVEWARAQKAFRSNGTTYPAHSWIVRMAQPYGGFAKALLETQSYPNLRDTMGHPIPPYDVTAHTLPLLMNVEVKPVPAPFKYPLGKGETVSTSLVGIALAPAPGVAIYRSNEPSIDEGWTRWVVNNEMKANGFEALATLNDKQTRAGSLAEKLRAIIIPDQDPKTILNGYKAGEMPPEYTGGLGQAGVKALREFVQQGGTLVCLNRASSFAIEQFKLPLHDVVAKVSEKEFYVPGSILRIELDTSNPIARGMPKESIAWVEDSPVFEIIRDNRGSSPTVKEGSASEMSAANVTVIARYPADRNPLLSGWLLGENRIRGKAALVEVSLGKGRIILFGFRPQYRGQSLATYPLFFNAISGVNQ
ncbi:MAG TPA: M14 metallopeptidase family protein [Pyrinomonadaceae bacterium]|nr:M14 metallopeptidase family protein [Pyrinomonadaceae bacterium]